MSISNSEYLKRYGEGKLTLGFTLRRIFFTENVSEWKKMDQRKDKKKEEEKKASEEHASSIAKITAVLNKSNTANYAGNFSYYIQSEGKGRANKVYGNISPNIFSLYGRNRPALVKFFSDYFELGKVACNYNYKSKINIDGKTVYPGCGKPYNWEAHHLIPGEVFTSMKSGVAGGSPIFNARQYRLLLMSDYNVNNGNNLIALPTNGMDFFQPVHDLIQHPSNHNAYTQRVIKEMKTVAKELNKLTEDLEKPHPNVVVKIAERLKGIEDDLWDLIISVGKACINSVVRQQEMTLSSEDKKLVKFQTEDGSTQYPLKALG